TTISGTRCRPITAPNQARIAGRGRCKCTTTRSTRRYLTAAHSNAQARASGMTTRSADARRITTCTRRWRFTGKVNEATWGFANGDNLWDMNDTDGQGHFVEGQPGFVFDSGTTTSGTTVSGAYATVSDTNKNWAVNQWRGFIIKHLRTGYGGLIHSNTANSITWAYNGSWPNPDRFNAG